MEARIYQPSKTAMSSGRGKCKDWLLEYAPRRAAYKDATMGWNACGDTREQICLRFPTREAAVAYAAAKGIAARVAKPRENRYHPKSYADNFR